MKRASLRLPLVALLAISGCSSSPQEPAPDARASDAGRSDAGSDAASADAALRADAFAIDGSHFDGALEGDASIDAALEGDASGESDSGADAGEQDSALLDATLDAATDAGASDAALELSDALFHDGALHHADARSPTDAASPSRARHRVLVVYTQGARARALARGTTPAAEAASLVAEANMIYDNSSIAIELELADVIETDHDEDDWTDPNQPVHQMISPHDGVMDELHLQRDVAAADLVVMITRFCGGRVADILADEGTAFAWASATVGCAGNEYSFTHEIGHLQGAHHQPPVPNAAFPHGHGFQITVPSGTFRTVMASGFGTRLPFFSGPGNVYEGIVLGTESVHDNTRVLNETAPIIEQLKTALASFWPNLGRLAPDGATVLPIIEVASDLECAERCRAETTCRGANFDVEQLTCELMPAHLGEAGWTLQPDDRSVFLDRLFLAPGEPAEPDQILPTFTPLDSDITSAAEVVIEEGELDEDELRIDRDLGPGLAIVIEQGSATRISIAGEAPWSTYAALLGSVRYANRVPTIPSAATGCSGSRRTIGTGTGCRASHRSSRPSACPLPCSAT